MATQESIQKHLDRAMAEVPGASILSLSFQGDEGEDFTKNGPELDEQSSESNSKASKVKAKRKKKDKERRDKSKPKPKAKPRAGSTGAGWKKCKTCGKFKEEDEFNASQAKCKECFNHARALQRIAGTQKSDVNLADLERDDPRQHAALMKAFIKERETSKKTGAKIQFSFQTFKTTYESQQGVRGEAEGEMMWEGEYLEWATKTAKGGYLSSQEAKNNWDQWMADKSVPRDTNGPRNYERLYVKVRDKVIDFQELSHKRGLSKEEKMNKNAPQAAIDARMKMVMGDDAVQKQEFGDFEALKEKGKHAFIGQGALSAEGVLAPDVDGMLATIQAKTKKRLATEEEDGSQCSKDEEKGEEDSDDGPGPEETPEKRKGWFDVETKTRRAQRSFQQQAASLEKDMAALDKDMTAAVADFRSKPGEAQLYDQEMQLVLRRQEWLQAVLENKDEELNNMIQQLTTTPEAGGTSVVTDSKDMSAVARAGPCAGFESLKVMSHLTQFAEQFRHCQSQEDIKKKFEEIAPSKKVITVLMSACKTSLNELLGARKRKQQQEAKEKEKAIKGAAKKRAAQGGVEGRALVFHLQIAFYPIIRHKIRGRLF